MKKTNKKIYLLLLVSCMLLLYSTYLFVYSGNAIANTIANDNKKGRLPEVAMKDYTVFHHLPENAMLCTPGSLKEGYYTPQEYTVIPVNRNKELIQCYGEQNEIENNFYLSIKAKKECYITVKKTQVVNICGNYFVLIEVVASTTCGTYV